MRAERAGTQIGIFCNSIYQRAGELGIRRILGVLYLAKKYGVAALEDACAAALEMGVHQAEGSEEPVRREEESRGNQLESRSAGLFQSPD